MGVIKNRINAVGIELEGAWTRQVDQPIQRDGSVEFPDAPQQQQPSPARVQRMGELHSAIRRGLGTAAERRIMQQEYEILAGAAMAAPNRTIGEIVLPPIAPDKFSEMVIKYYPDKVNATCGLHVHMSFPYRIYYHRLMTPAFTDTMVKSLQEWGEEEKLAKDHPLWGRVTDANHRHCAHAYLGDNQVSITKKDYNSRGTPYSRYTAINYPLSQHGTVECRLLPMMETAEQGVRAIQRVIDTTNGFLHRARGREPRKIARVVGLPTLREVYRASV